MLKTKNPITIFILMLVFSGLSCNLPGTTVSSDSTPPVSISTDAAIESTATAQPEIATATPNPSPTIELPTPTISIPHSLIPSTSVKAGDRIRDVVSVDTAAENRAPYGDSYNISLFERPFLQDMSYVPDLDIASFNLNYDEKFYYVSIELVGTNPNNKIGIQYAVELDIDADGFGDYIIVAVAPFNVGWDTTNVKVFQDTNHDTGGLSPEKSDAPLPGDGYETLIFDGGSGQADDTDLAWARINAGKYATVQFAFKKSLPGTKFMYGVIADASIRSAAEFDYVDRFTEDQAGSPERNEKEYPLKALYGVDNVCREVQGFPGTGDEPRRCLSN